MGRTHDKARTALIVATIGLAVAAAACADHGDGELADTAVAAQALTQQLRLPFPPGHTWYICQSYVGFSHQSNRPFDIGWTQASCNGGNNDSGGRPIVASGSGKVSHMPNSQAGGDFMCISLTGGGSIALGHVKPGSGIALGSSVTAGQQVATVRTSTDPDAQNAGIAHLHFEGWSGDACYTGTAQAFTGAWKMECAPDLPYNAEYGHYNGTPITACAIATGPATEHDVDGDGRADLVSARDDGNAWVWAGKADGTFAAAVSSFGGSLDAANVDGSGHYLVGVADVTGEGRSDLVSVGDDGSAYVWPGQSTKKFGSAVSSFAGTYDLANLDGSGHQVVGVADVTGDGRADLVSAHGNGNAYVYPGAASGAFGSSVASFEGTFDSANHDGTGHYAVGVADVTGDGRADLVTVHENGNGYVYPGQSGGSFGSGVASFDGTLDHANWDGSGHHVVDVADVTGDGKADLVTVHTDGNAYVYPGQASGAFASGVASFDKTMDLANHDGTGHWVVGLADITGDGSADLVSMADDGNAYVWPGNSKGGFGSAVSSFDTTMDFANHDGTGHYIVAPTGPDGESSLPDTSAASTGQEPPSGAGTSASGMDPVTDDDAGGRDDGSQADARGLVGSCSCRIGPSTAPSPLQMAWLGALAWLVASRRRKSVRGARARGPVKSSVDLLLLEDLDQAVCER
jgi:MYXO-CTERM domain-containing protein